jgi:hypothetical protein
MTTKKVFSLRNYKQEIIFNSNIAETYYTGLEE